MTHGAIALEDLARHALEGDREALDVLAHALQGDIYGLAPGRYVTAPLIVQGQTAWTNSRSLTGTYTLHLSRGNYLSLSAGLQRGAASTPKVKTALTTTAYWILYL